eukprot:2027140-Rhodomonas_salina.2
MATATTHEGVLDNRIGALKSHNGQALGLATSESPTESPVSTAGAPRTILTPLQKLISIVLFFSMWGMPQVLDQNGWSTPLGSEIHTPWGLPRVYTGTATHANMSFFIFYTAWIRYMSTIVSPRHRVRIETASIWIPSVRHRPWVLVAVVVVLNRVVLVETPRGQRKWGLNSQLRDLCRDEMCALSCVRSLFVLPAILTP